MEIPSLKEMLEAGVHFGHRTKNWHPKMEKFILTSRKGVHIIDLLETQKRLEIALEFMVRMKKEGKTILFVGTKKQVKDNIKDLAIDLKMPYVNEKWIGGLLTNFFIIKKSIKKYNDLVKQQKDGSLNKYTKKEQGEFNKEIQKLDKKFKGIANLTKMPDVIFIWDVKVEKLAITEAKKRNIPVIAICDTNVNVDMVNYPIPANDDATKTIELFFGLIKKTLI